MKATYEKILEDIHIQNIYNVLKNMIYNRPHEHNFVKYDR